VYPLLRLPLHNLDSYFLRFSLDLACGGVPRTAWLDFDLGTVGTPVTIRFETSLVACYRLVPRYIAANVQTISAMEGKPVKTTYPCSFTVFNASAGATQAFGCTEDPVTGVLIFSLLGACSLTAPKVSNFVFSRRLNDSATAMETGMPYSVASSDGRALRALPTLCPDVFQLAWRNVSSTDGIPIQEITFASTRRCC
jgi:hypothetical protein